MDVNQLSLLHCRGFGSLIRIQTPSFIAGRRASFQSNILYTAMYWITTTRFKSYRISYTVLIFRLDFSGKSCDLFVSFTKWQTWLCILMLLSYTDNDIFLVKSVLNCQSWVCQGYIHAGRKSELKKNCFNTDQKITLFLWLEPHFLTGTLNLVCLEMKNIVHERV